MDEDVDSIREMREEREQELQKKIQNDQYWQQLERSCGHDD